ncbi:hypothetical protein A9Q99_08585 [Gammaproteobacteria bacterium 45_16_T64]|nr:hypothetical protein A9Q99_08585 [Gammaproteobacteria bacterium 45_16_T64]
MNNAINTDQQTTNGQQVAELYTLLSSLAQNLFNTKEIQHEQHALIKKTQMLENQIHSIQNSRRKGIPDGFISKKEAYFTHGLGLSERVFHLALFTMGVNTHEYVHLSEAGHEVDTFSYEEREVIIAIDIFLDDAIQVTGQTCESSILQGKRFRYIKSIQKTA